MASSSTVIDSLVLSPEWIIVHQFWRLFMNFDCQCSTSDGASSFKKVVETRTYKIQRIRLVRRWYIDLAQAQIGRCSEMETVLRFKDRFVKFVLVRTLKEGRSTFKADNNWNEIYIHTDQCQMWDTIIIMGPFSLILLCMLL